MPFTHEWTKLKFSFEWERLANCHLGVQPVIMENWTTGYTQSQLDEAQERYDIQFPPDLISLFLEMRPVDGYQWDTENQRIRDMLAWPLTMLLAEVDNGAWWPEWGERPKEVASRHEVVRHALKHAPRLVPLLGHRFIPETPKLPGNPIFSMYGFDTIYYGANLTEYFANEFSGTCDISEPRYIEFWSNITKNWKQVTFDPQHRSDGS